MKAGRARWAVCSRRLDYVFRMTHYTAMGNLFSSTSFLPKEHQIYSVFNTFTEHNELILLALCFMMIVLMIIQPMWRRARVTWS